MSRMAQALCARCGANLNAVPAGEPCPSCGGTRRDVRIEVPAASMTLTAAPVAVIVRQALDELAALPEEERGAVVRQLVQLAGRIEGTARLAGTAELVRATDAGPRSAPRPPPWSLAGWSERHPALWWLLNRAADAGATLLLEEALRQLGPLIASGYLAVAPPAPSGEPPQPPAIVEPAPQPPADVCLPGDEPALK